ncbi:trehalose-6-phosphate synthase [bacterium]|nr:trehalose-6-phosphate synthase [bacterium]
MRRWLSQLAYFGNAQLASQPLRKLRKQATQTHDQRVIIVSNRVSPLKGGKVNTGGLAVAMSGVLQNHGGIWVGWSGKVSDSRAPQEQTQGDVSHIVRDLSAAEHEGFYQQFCNGVLWPLMHENVGLSSFSSAPYETYLEVNRQFADLLVERLKPTDVIWVHDFHFIPLAAALRARGVTNRIGFFLHTPFASKDVLLTLPVHKQLMECLYAYDVVGFQTQRDLEAFRDYSASENLRPEGDGETARETMFGHFPIGIQTERFHAMAERTQYDPKAKDLLASLAGRQLILGVDRLDYSKGIVPRMKAIDTMLANDQSLRKAFSFLQIAPPTREGVEQYAQLRAETEALVGHINGKYADVDWVPIRFLVSGVRRELLAAFYRMARVCLVTPLRDGMNLVAKEFIAAQDPENPGVLVLSRFAGAAEELQQAMLVNPYDVEDMASSIRQALAMPLRERKERWQALYRTISNQTLEHWYQDFLDALTG